MSLGFILGDATKNHQETLMQQITQWQKENPRAKIYYIVPNHNKFSAEIKVLDYLRKQENNQKLFATSNVQTFSFTRLAWYFMQDTAIYQTPRVTTGGLNMLVYRSLREHSDELTVFKGEQTQTGFINQLVSQLLELQQACLSVEDITTMMEQLNKENNPINLELKAKLHDLRVIYRDFLLSTDGKYLKQTDILPALAQFLQTQDLTRSYFIFEGFSQFSAQEQAVVATILQKAKEVRMSLILNKGVTDIDDLSDKQALFYRSEKTYYSLYQQARKMKVKILNNIYAKNKYVETKELQELAQYWEESIDLKPIMANKIGINHNLRVFQAYTRMAEIKAIATKIRRMVALENYHYSDILLLTPDLEIYRNILEPVFSDFQIPFFMDGVKKMSDHPLVELLTALFNVKERHYRYADIMRLLKTELLIPKTEYGYLNIETFRTYLDLTENLILKFGYEGNRWIQKEDWTAYRFGVSDFGTQTTAQEKISKQVNIIRHYVKEILPKFFKKLDNAKTGKEAAQTLMKFLLKNGVDEQLLKWRDDALKQGNIVLSERPEQVWNAFCDLIDEYVNNLGDFKFESEDFLNLLQTGFEGVSYRQVPSTLDQVIVSKTDVAQNNNHRITFIFGATDLVMPKRIQDASIITDDDREVMQKTLDEDKYLADTAEIRMATEPYMNYLAFMTSKEKLYLFYPTASANEEGLKISPYIERIVKYFNLPITEIKEIPTLDDTEIVDFVATKRTTLSNLIQIARQAKGQQKSLPDIWKKIYQELLDDINYKKMTEKLMSGVEYTNIPERLKAENVEELYGKTLNTSVSKFEEFFKNQYAFFLKYGLKLRERDVFDLSPANTGEFYHMALDNLLKALKQDNLSIVDVDEKQFEIYLNVISEQLAGLPQFQILQSTNRMQFIFKQLKATVQQVGWAIHNQSKRTNMRPLKTEVLFGHVGVENGLQALKYELDNEHIVNVRGKIDRIDKMVVDDKVYLGIVDYKSSNHKFNYQDAYHGLALQMLTYLNAMIKNADLLVNVSSKEQIKPAGAVYMHLQNPIINRKEILKIDKQMKDAYDEILLKKNKYDGLILKDQELLSNLDTSIQQSDNSIIYPIRRNKDGFYGGFRKY